MASSTSSPSSTDTVTETLHFPDVKKKTHPLIDDADNYEPALGVGGSIGDRPVQCVLCEERFELPASASAFHEHLSADHRLIIQNPELICDLTKYVEYWRKCFIQENYKSICRIQGNYYTLDSTIASDSQIREYLQRKRLDAVLKVQQAERDDVILSRSCLFCRETFTGNRAELFNHMAFSHSFNVGLPDNIVFAKEFLDLLEKTLESLQCLYCEKIFRDKTALKDHMRKKQHRRLNPDNKAYDRFYVINYLEPGRDWQAVQAERDGVVASAAESGDEESWADWEEDFHTNLVCLFCKHNTMLLEDLLSHIKDTHNFDFLKFREENALSFYDQVKLVNFIRRRIHQATCVCCEERVGEGSGPSMADHLLHHHRDDLAQGMPRDKWDQTQFLFPTFENDALLCSLEDCSEDEDEEAAKSLRSSTTNIPVLAEEDPHISEDSILVREGNILWTLMESR